MCYCEMYSFSSPSLVLGVHVCTMVVVVFLVFSSGQRFVIIEQIASNIFPQVVQMHVSNTAILRTNFDCIK